MTFLFMLECLHRGFSTSSQATVCSYHRSNDDFSSGKEVGDGAGRSLEVCNRYWWSATKLLRREHPNTYRYCVHLILSQHVPQWSYYADVRRVRVCIIPFVS